MELKFCGTRGSCAAPYGDRSVYGGNTSCVSIRSGNRWLILDGGTGIIPLAAEIREAAAVAPCTVQILLTHFHLDHIMGLPIFLAMLPNEVDVTLYATPCTGYAGTRPYAESLTTLIGPPLWPVTLPMVCPQLKFEDLAQAQCNDIGGIMVEPMASNHPNETSIYRIRWEGRDIVYGLDCEITDAFEDTYIHFVEGCDVLLFDGCYTDEDYERCIGFGHSAFSRAFRIAEVSRAGSVYMLHYDYGYTDAQLAAAEKSVTDRCSRIRFAREGMEISL